VKRLAPLLKELVICNLLPPLFLVLPEHCIGQFDELFLEKCCVMTMFEWVYTHYSQIKNALALVSLWFCTGNARVSVQEFWQAFLN